MISKIISHNETESLSEIINFMMKSESLFNTKSPQSLAAHQIILKFFFDDKSKFVVLFDDHTIIACATITTNENYPQTAFIGNYHLPIDAKNRESVRKFFFETIYSYAKSQTITSLVGPINFNTWLSNRFKYPVDSELQPWEPSNPKEYPEDFEKEQFTIDKKYFSYFLPTINDIDVFKSHHGKILSQGFRITPINLNDEADQKILYQLNCECFSENYFYTDINFTQYKNTHLASLKGADLRYSAFIENDERKWGYIFNIPSGDYVIIKTILVSPLCRAGGIGSALLYETLNKGRIDGFTKLIGAMVREGNASQHFFKNVSPPDQVNQYLLFKKVIS